MQLRSACTNKTVMSTEDVVKSLFSLQRKISGCLRPSRSLAQTPSSYKEVLAQATLETDAYAYMLGRLLAGSIFLEFLFLQRREKCE